MYEMYFIYSKPQMILFAILKVPNTISYSLLQYYTNII